MAFSLEELGRESGDFTAEELSLFENARRLLPEEQIRSRLLDPTGARFDVLRKDIERAETGGQGLNLLNLDNLEPTFLDEFPRGSAGQALSTFSRFRNLLGIPRPGRSAIGRLSARQLEKPEETPGFKLAQNLLTEKSQARRENINEILRRSGIGGTFSGPGVERLLQPFERETDIALGNLGLEAGKQAEDRSLDILRLGETSFTNELRTAQAIEQLGQNRQLQRDLADKLLKAGLGQAAGSLLAKGVPGLIDFISELFGSDNAQDRTTGQKIAGIVQSATGALGRLIFGGGGGGGDFDFSQSPSNLEDFGNLDTLISLGEGSGGGGGGFDLSALGELDDFGPFFSDFFNAPAEAAAGAAGAEGAGGFNLGTFADLGLDLPFIGGLNLASIPLGIIGGGLMAQFMSLFGPDTEAKWEAKADQWIGSAAQEIKANPGAWLAKMEADFGPGGRILGQKLLKGPITAADIKADLGLPDYISPSDIEGAIGNAPFNTDPRFGLGAAPRFLALGQAHLKNFVQNNVGAIRQEQLALGQGDLSMEQINQYYSLIENADPQTQAFIRDFKDANGREPTMQEIQQFQAWLADRSE